MQGAKRLVELWQLGVKPYLELKVGDTQLTLLEYAVKNNLVCLVKAMKEAILLELTSEPRNQCLLDSALSEAYAFRNTLRRAKRLQQIDIDNDLSA